MKKYKIVMLCCSLLFAGAIITNTTGCKSAQTITYQTIYGLERSTTAVYDGYLDQILKGTVKTNDFPTISKTYNDFQLGVQLAIATAQFNTNAPAPADLVTKALNLKTTITEAKVK